MHEVKKLRRKEPPMERRRRAIEVLTSDSGMTANDKKEEKLVLNVIEWLKGETEKRSPTGVQRVRWKVIDELLANRAEDA
eukprot:2925571-Heterocapsa_arctica.AAC.1